MKKIILFDSNKFPKNFLRDLRKKFANIKLVVIKDTDINKLYDQIGFSNALIDCPRKYFNNTLISKFKKYDL